MQIDEQNAALNAAVTALAELSSAVGTQVNSVEETCVSVEPFARGWRVSVAGRGAVELGVGDLTNARRARDRFLNDVGVLVRIQDGEAFAGLVMAAAAACRALRQAGD